jgi:hypothetical protein
MQHDNLQSQLLTKCGSDKVTDGAPPVVIPLSDATIGQHHHQRTPADPAASVPHNALSA